MTQTPSRDWQKDMETTKKIRSGGNGKYAPAGWLDALEYWLQEAKERGEREQQLKEDLTKMYDLMKDALGCMVMLEGKDGDHVQRIVNVFRALYPDTPAPKEGSS
ncbi:hypothetical protein MHH28_07775 [Paenibacillus sp. FSL K6-1217]|uniref:hypothetical protein n=1 Tax=Paenibacillus sp. FSL K6-1217 TaxID=2921466 RepID=UPI0032503365